MKAAKAKIKPSPINAVAIPPAVFAGVLAKPLNPRGRTTALMINPIKGNTKIRAGRNE
jgi:hypothetical protein